MYDQSSLTRVGQLSVTCVSWAIGTGYTKIIPAYFASYEDYFEKGRVALFKGDMSDLLISFLSAFY